MEKQAIPMKPTPPPWRLGSVLRVFGMIRGSRGTCVMRVSGRGCDGNYQYCTVQYNEGLWEDSR